MVPSQHAMKKVGATLGAALLLALAGGPARADDRASARALFDEGRQLMADGNIASACAKFEAASRLTTTAGVRLNLAGCWSKLGRTASAWAMYDEARALAERSGDAAAADLAQKGKAELEPRLSRLIITVANANAVGLVVQRDGEQVFSGAWGVGLPVDPGEHEITAHAPGRKDWSAKVTILGEGATGSVMVPVLAAEGNAAAVAPIEVANAPAIGRSGIGALQVTGIVAGGVGVVALGTATAFGFLSGSALSDQQNACGSTATCPNRAQALDHLGYTTDRAVETAGFIAGGVFVAAGVAHFVVGSRKDAPQTGLVVLPEIARGTAGVTFQGRF